MRRNLKKKSQNKRECKVSNCKSSLLQLQSNGAQDLLAIHQTSSVFLSCWDVSRNMYDFVIVGAGLVGSAAAKYICKLSPGSRVCLVGPNEPSKQERTLESGRRVFGAHDDEGRITRTLATNSVWAKLANRSIKRYRAIERESGVSFFSEVGTMHILDTSGDRVRAEALKESIVQLCAENNVRASVVDGVKLMSEFPFLSVPDSCSAVWEKQHAGHISPRCLVRAQVVLAKKYGCTVMRDVVTSIRECVYDKCLTVVLEHGAPVQGRSVLLASGSMTNFLGLLPGQQSLAMTPLTETVVLAELSEKQARQLSSMPCVMVDSVWHDHAFPLPNDGFHHAYVLPPVRYPDGQVYLKIGHGKEFDKPLRDLRAYREWYCGKGSPTAAATLAQALQRLIPSLQPQRLITDSCATLTTQSGIVYIDSVPGMSHGKLFVAVGGNGVAAKSSDEVGRMAALMVVAGQWNYDLPAELFRAHWNRLPAKL